MRIQALNFLQTKDATTKQIRDKYDFDLNGLRVIMSRLVSEGKIKIVGNIGREYIYSMVNCSVNLETSKLAFTEMFEFFKLVMQNSDVIADKVKWDELWSSKNKELVYNVAKRMELI